MHYSHSMQIDRIGGEEPVQHMLMALSYLFVIWRIPWICASSSVLLATGSGWDETVKMLRSVQRDNDPLCSVRLLLWYTVTGFRPRPACLQWSKQDGAGSFGEREPKHSNLWGNRVTYAKGSAVTAGIQTKLSLSGSIRFTFWTLWRNTCLIHPDLDFILTFKAVNCAG